MTVKVSTKPNPSDATLIGGQDWNTAFGSVMQILGPFPVAFDDADLVGSGAVYGPELPVGVWVIDMWLVVTDSFTNNTTIALGVGAVTDIPGFTIVADAGKDQSVSVPYDAARRGATFPIPVRLNVAGRLVAYLETAEVSGTANLHAIIVTPPV